MKTAGTFSPVDEAQLLAQEKGTTHADEQGTE